MSTSQQQPNQQQTTYPNKHGFGSFHTERDEDRMDYLIALPEDQYKPPVLPVSITFPTINYHQPICPNQILSEPPTINQSIDSIHNSNEQITTSSDPTSSSTQLTTVEFGRQTLTTWFHLDPSFTFINHGAFGACFKIVSESERLWHNYMESQPLRFIDRKLLPILVYTTRNIAKFIHVDPMDLVILPNVTTGLNTVLRSIDWFPETSSTTQSSINDISNQTTTTTITPPTTTNQSSTISTSSPPSTKQQSFIITFDTGYGATKQMIKATQHQFNNSQQEIIHQDLPITFPVSSPREIVQLLRHTLRKHAKNNTIHQIKLVIVDYIQSNSALVFPVEELCTLCYEYNIPILVDGAHSLGSFDLNFQTQFKHKPTFFVANAHKWLCSGKGVSILYVDRTWHHNIKPAVVSHGYSSETLSGKFTWIGLQDYCHYLSLNTTLDVWKYIGIDNIRLYISTMIQNVTKWLMKEWNSDCLGPQDMFKTMVCIRLPGPRVPQSGTEHTDIQDLLYFKYNIEAPIKMLQNRLYIRISCHIYNDWTDFQRLSQVMKEIRPPLNTEDDEKDIIIAENAEVVKPCTSCG